MSPREWVANRQQRDREQGIAGEHERRPKRKLPVPDHLPRNRAQRISVVEVVARDDEAATRKAQWEEGDEEEHGTRERQDVRASCTPPLAQVVAAHGVASPPLSSDRPSRLRHV